jgi:hypothetical protein
VDKVSRNIKAHVSMESSYDELDMSKNHLTISDGAKRLCGGQLQDSDIARRQEMLDPIIFWSDVSTPIIKKNVSTPVQTSE